MFSPCPYCGNSTDTGGKCWNPACLTQVATIPRVVPQDPLMTTVPWVTPGPTGWRCPACGGGNAPWVGRCPCTPPPPAAMPLGVTEPVLCVNCGKPVGWPLCAACDHDMLFHNAAADGAELPERFTCSRCHNPNVREDGGLVLYICAACWRPRRAETHRVVGTVPVGHEGDFVNNPKTEPR